MSAAGKGARPGRSRTPTRDEREAAQRAQIVARRAIRRLDILEWVLFAVGAGLAAAGGALIAAMLSALEGWDFRSTWIGASLLLFVVPGVFSIRKIRREERDGAPGMQRESKEDDG